MDDMDSGDNIKLKEEIKFERALVLCRISTPEQNLEQQVEFMKEWCNNRKILIKKIVKEIGSGTISYKNRPKLLTGIERIELGEYDCVAVYNIDRITRNWYDSVMIEKLFVDNWNKCKLLSATGNFDLSSAMGRAMYRFKMLFDCFMPEDMKEKQKVGIARAKKEGKYKGRRPGTKNFSETVLAAVNEKNKNEVI